MVYHFHSVQCPYCGETADSRRLADNEILFGTPFRSCPHCGKQYFDDAYKEKALLLYSDDGVHFNFWAAAWLVLSLIFMVAFIVEGVAVAAIAFGIIFVRRLYILICTIRNRAHPEIYHQRRLDQLENYRESMYLEQSQSMERLSDPAYLNKLRANGVEIPVYFYQRLGISPDMESDESSL